ncbi:hypothetical protein F3Y22_tig00113724pilonHSYRG00148 [Hibiscus syriacus]|uniref:J domain-containing protein n=1 Tax=Hibiscus syriacus TaxID=106335 RepID=A0A6A2XI21_HIBSY|nr:hypothetical protein F3Y22_tig00113724pilonHSYRG00148 [Hibiscus syriacus]
MGLALPKYIRPLSTLQAITRFLTYLLHHLNKATNRDGNGCSNSIAPAAEKRCLYELLGLSLDCSQDEIRSAYKKLALQRHPDIGLKMKGEEERGRKKKLEEERMTRVKAYEEPEWAKVEEEEQVDELEEKEGEKACNKKFKSEKQWKNHEQSKKHKAELRKLGVTPRPGLYVSTKSSGSHS